MDTIKERIIQNMVLALGAISLANGSSIDIASIQRYQYTGIQLETVPLIQIRQGDDLVVPDQGAPPSVFRELDVYVSFVHRPPVDDAIGNDAMLNAIGTDIERALMADPTRGGLAIWTKSPDWMEAVVSTDEPHLAQAWRYVVQYRHHFQNPAVNG